MGTIEERREVRVSGSDSDFVFLVEPEKGRLVIRQEGEDEDVCSLEVSSSDQLIDFMEGLRRALAPFGVAAGDEWRDGRDPPAVSPPEGNGAARGADRDIDAETIAKARERNANAFRSWSKDEERRMVAAFDDGRPIAEIASELGRSQRAVTMRLQKLGVTDSG